MMRQFSAGGVVYKKEGERILFLLRKGKFSPQFPGSSEWSLPKGWIDDAPDNINPGPLTLGQKRASEDQLRNSALREVAEEAGVKAKIVHRLGTIKFFFTDSNRQKVVKSVIFYLMEYDSDIVSGPGWETEEVTWKDAHKARELLHKRKGESEMIEKANKFISSGQQSLI